MICKHHKGVKQKENPVAPFGKRGRSASTTRAVRCETHVVRCETRVAGSVLSMGGVWNGTAPLHPELNRTSGCPGYCLNFLKCNSTSKMLLHFLKIVHVLVKRKILLKRIYLN